MRIMDMAEVGPGAGATMEVAKKGGGKPVLGLEGADRSALDAVKEKGGVVGKVAEYFGEVDNFLGATDARVKGLDDDWNKLGVETKGFIEGLNTLSRVTEKDVDRVAGKVVAVKILRAAEAQMRVGTGRVSDEQAGQLIDEAQGVWVKLTPRARAQVQRGLRDLATDGHLWAQAKVKVGDWTVHQTVERDEKNSLQQVMADTMNKMREVARGFGAENLEKGVNGVADELSQQITEGVEDVTGRLGKGIEGLKLGIGVYSSRPEVQEKVVVRLKEVEEAKVGIAAGVEQAKKGKWDDVKYLGELQRVVGLTDTVMTDTSMLLKEAGMRGRAATVKIGAMEVQTATKGSVAGESAIKVVAGLEIADQLGLLDRDLRIRFGTLGKTDVLNVVAERLPFVGGLKHDREVIKSRAQEQMRVVAEMLTGEYGKKVGEHLKVWLDEEASLAQGTEALRALKGVGMDMVVLGEFRRDIATMAKAKIPDKGLTEGMKGSWQKMHELAVELDAKLSVESQGRPIENLSDKHASALAKFSMGSLESHLKAVGYSDVDPAVLHNADGWRGFVLGNVGEKGVAKALSGRWMREALSKIWSNRSPDKLTGVEVTRAGEYKISGVSAEVGKALIALERVVGSKDKMLDVALATAEDTRKLNAQIAVLMVRSGMGDAGERLRAIWERKDWKGTGAEVTAKALIDKLRLESITQYQIAGSVVAVLSPLISLGLGQGLKELGEFTRKTLERLGLDVDKAKEVLAMWRGTGVGDASATGPFEGQVENAMRNAGQQVIDTNIRAQESLISRTERLLLENAWFKDAVGRTKDMVLAAGGMMAEAIKNPAGVAALGAAFGTTMAGAVEAIKRIPAQTVGTIGGAVVMGGVAALGGVTPFGVAASVGQGAFYGALLTSVVPIVRAVWRGRGRT